MGGAICRTLLRWVRAWVAQGKEAPIETTSSRCSSLGPRGTPLRGSRWGLKCLSFLHGLMHHDHVLIPWNYESILWFDPFSMYKLVLIYLWCGIFLKAQIMVDLFWWEHFVNKFQAFSRTSNLNEIIIIIIMYYCLTPAVHYYMMLLMVSMFPRKHQFLLPDLALIIYYKL